MNKIIGLFLVMFVVGCSGIKSEAVYPEENSQNKYGMPGEKEEGIFGANGISFGENKSKEVGGLKINSYLWRASLDTISFMPLASADPFGGVIITDWYSADKSSNERFKLNIVIMSAALRADGVKVSAFKETKGENGKWQKQEADTEIARKIESAILTKARELKVSE